MSVEQSDGDDVWDRAIGPLQFIPTTWALAGVDGDAESYPVVRWEDLRKQIESICLAGERAGAPGEDRTTLSITGRRTRTHHHIDRRRHRGDAGPPARIIRTKTQLPSEENPSSRTSYTTVVPPGTSRWWYASHNDLSSQPDQR